MIIAIEMGLIPRAAQSQFTEHPLKRRLRREIDSIIMEQKAKGTPFMPASMKVDRAQVIIDRMAEKAPRGAYNAREGGHYE